jgi:hypothetical protein
MPGRVENMRKPFRILPLSVCVILVNAAMAAFCAQYGEERDGRGGRDEALRLRALADFCAVPAEAELHQLETRTG